MLRSKLRSKSVILRLTAERQTDALFSVFFHVIGAPYHIFIRDYRPPTQLRYRPESLRHQLRPRSLKNHVCSKHTLVLFAPLISLHCEMRFSSSLRIYNTKLVWL